MLCGWINNPHPDLSDATAISHRGFNALRYRLFISSHMLPVTPINPTPGLISKYDLYPNIQCEMLQCLSPLQVFTLAPLPEKWLTDTLVLWDSTRRLDFWSCVLYFTLSALKLLFFISPRTKLDALILWWYGHFRSARSCFWYKWSSLHQARPL